MYIYRDKGEIPHRIWFTIETVEGKERGHLVLQYPRRLHYNVSYNIPKSWLVLFDGLPFTWCLGEQKYIYLFVEHVGGIIVEK